MAKRSEIKAILYTCFPHPHALQICQPTTSIIPLPACPIAMAVLALNVRGCPGHVVDSSWREAAIYIWLGETLISKNNINFWVGKFCYCTLQGALFHLYKSNQKVGVFGAGKTLSDIIRMGKIGLAELLNFTYKSWHFQLYFPFWWRKAGCDLLKIKENTK